MFSSSLFWGGAVHRVDFDFYRNTTVRDAAKKVMGDVAIAYIEGVGGVRVAEMDIVEVGKNDVSNFIRGFTGWLQLIILIPDIVIQSGEGLIASLKPLAEALLVEREGNKVLCNSKVIRMRCQKIIELGMRKPQLFHKSQQVKTTSISDPVVP